MIKLIGTNHLMNKKEIYDIINKEKPDVIGVELCNTRFNLMVLPKLNQQEDYFEPKEQKDDTILGKISDALKNKAKESNLEYGSDMINASIYAKENNIPLEFLDLDVYRIRELMEKTPDNEKKGFMEELQKFESISMKEVQDNINPDETLNELKTNYPISFEFLITIRELFISKNILKLERKYPGKKILVMVGDGHIKAIKKEIEI